MLKSKANKLLVAFALIVGSLYVIFNLYLSANNIRIASKQFTYRFFEQDSSTSTKKSECRLRQLYPWDSQLLPYLYPDWDPYRTCFIKRQMHTELKYNTLRMLDNTTSECEYRCLYANGELDFKTSNWSKMEKNGEYYENCDFIETHCMEDKNTTFRYIHSQALKPKEKQFQKEDELHPGVFMLVFDSTSSSSGMRTIVRTNQVLRQFYDATTFYYHNKAGLNSRPNAFAMFSGTRISELDKRRFPGRDKSEYPNSCKDGVKRNETITYDFVDQNYASVIAEDWAGAFNYPNCKGYGDPPTDHYASTVVLRTTGRKNKNDFEDDFYTGECQEPYHKLLDYLSKFLEKYQGISKFVMIWLSLVAHNSANGLYRTDKYFADFFRQHINNLENSFVFLMGDHGLRFGDIRRTPLGETEDNNPLLMVALPKYLRSNEQLLMNLKQNSRRHTSQFDFYATLYDIARYARKDNFQKWDEHDFRSELGEKRGGIRAKSLLRPILYDRTCQEMEISDEYCICEQIWHKSDIYGDDTTKAAQFLIANINDSLKQKNLSGLCETLTFIKVISAESLEGEPVLKIVVNASPSDGNYQAQLLKENDGFKIITKITRLDQYGEQGHCAPVENVRQLCYCRIQLTTKRFTKTRFTMARLTKPGKH
uniref:Sulfatase domain-containing protein n=1 Tax=Elaeophora elaphi TaxID=1147741 RepID=A0A0R3S0V7_9BILA